MATIRAAHYDETVKKMRRDPILWAMALSLNLAPRETIVHDNGGARFEFMTRANDEYHNVRGGEIYGHIGAVAEALLSLLDNPPTVEERFYSIDIETLFLMFEHAPKGTKLIGELAYEIDRREGLVP